MVEIRNKMDEWYINEKQIPGLKLIELSISEQKNK